MARDQKRENQRENLVEASSSSSQIRGTGSTRLKATAKPVATPTSAPAPAAQKLGGWESWRNSLLSNLAYVINEPSSPQAPPPVMPKDPPKGFTPSWPSKNESTGFGSLNNPALGVSGVGENSAWGAAKAGPAPTTEKTSAASNLDHKPAGSPICSGETNWGSSTSESGGGQNLATGPRTKHAASSMNTASLENIPVVKIELVLTPGSIKGKKENGDTREREETGVKNPSPACEKAPKKQVEGIEESAKPEEVTVATEDEFDWVKPRRRRRKQIAHVALVEGAIDGASGGGKKKKKKGKR